VFLGGEDAAAAEAFFDGLQVGAAGEEPGGVGMAEVVCPNADTAAGGDEGGYPDVFTEPRPRDMPIGVGVRLRVVPGAGWASLLAARRSAR